MASKISEFGRRLLANWQLKLLAIVVAAISYYAVRGATSSENVYDIPIEIRLGKGKGVAVLDQDARTVRVTLRGSRDDLRRVDRAHLKAVLSPRVDVAASTRRIPIRFADIDGVHGVRVVDVRPTVVAVTFDEECEKQIDVAKPDTEGTPRAGQVSIDYKPHRVTIWGPKQLLADKHTLFAEPVNIEGSVGSFSTTVRVLPPEGAWATRIEPDEVAVKVTIASESDTKQWDNIPVLAMMQPSEVKRVAFDPPVVSVTLEGRAEALDAILGAAIRIYVDCRGLDPSATYELPVIIHMPATADVRARAEPNRVKVAFHAGEG